MTHFIVTMGETKVYDGNVRSIGAIRAFLKLEGVRGKVYFIKRVLKDGTVKEAGYCVIGSKLIYKSLWRNSGYNYYVWESGRLYSKQDEDGKWYSHDWVSDEDNRFIDALVSAE